MSVLECILNKFKAQKPTFTLDGEQVTYRQLPQKQKDALQKGGYITEDMVNKIQQQVNEKIRSGMSHAEAAVSAHDTMLSAANDKITKLSTSHEAYLRAATDIADASSRGVPIKAIARGLLVGDPGTDVRYGAAIQNSGSVFHNAYTFGLQRYARALEPLVSELPVSLGNVVDAGEELKMAKAIFGDSSIEARYHKGADAIKTFVDTVNKDAHTTGRSAIENPNLVKSLFTRGDKTRANFKNINNFLSPEKLDWSVANKRAGHELTAAEQNAYLKDVINSARTERTYETKSGLDVRESDLSFKSAEDWIAYQQKFGQGSILGVLSNLREHAAHEFAIGKSFGGNPEMFRTSVLAHVAENYPEQAAQFAKTFNDYYKDAMMPPRGNGNTISATIGRVIKDAIVASHIGQAGIASVTHTGTGSIYMHNIGIPASDTVSQITRDIMKRAFNPEEFKEFQRALSQAQLNNEMVMRKLNKVHDLNQGNPVSRFYDRAASQVSNIGGLGAMATAAKDGVGLVANQELARFISLGKSVAEGSDYLKATGFTDAELAALKPFIYENAGAGLPVKHIDIAKAYNSDIPAVQDAAMKAHIIMDRAGKSLFPHSNDLSSIHINKLRAAGPVGEALANVISPLTGYMLGFWGDVLKPTLMTPGGHGLANIVQLMAAMQMMGSVQVQLRRLNNGQDLLPIGPRLAAQSSVAAALGPVVASATAELGTAHRFDGSLMDKMPGMLMLKDLTKLTGENIFDLAHGKETHFTRDAMRLMMDFTPGQNLPVAHLALQHLITDPIQKRLDPAGFYRTAVAKEKDAALDKSGVYYRPGEILPHRAPIITH